jgi:hypothetical protein
MHITTNPLKIIMPGYHTITKLGHNIVLKEIQHLTGMTHCASFSGMEQFGSGSRGTVNFFISCLFREQSELLTRGAGDDLRTVA